MTGWAFEGACGTQQEGACHDVPDREQLHERDDRQYAQDRRLNGLRDDQHLAFTTFQRVSGDLVFLHKNKLVYSIVNVTREIGIPDPA